MKVLPFNLSDKIKSTKLWASPLKMKKRFLTEPEDSP